ncbi:MAG: carbohydrate-binding protein, partial [Spirochaetaceae bacterium]|nr:carbohydrate-binding protein [Spirochaetaceae bacterium]
LTHTPAYYNLDFEVAPESFITQCASLEGSGNIEIHLDSIDGQIVGECAISDTGSWDSYETFKCNITTPLEGVHKIYLVFKNNGDEFLFNVKSWHFSRDDMDTEQTPYQGTAFEYPGKIEAEDFDYGGQRISYFDNDSGNTGE